LPHVNTESIRLSILTRRGKRFNAKYFPYVAYISKTRPKKRTGVRGCGTRRWHKIWDTYIFKQPNQKNLHKPIRAKFFAYFFSKK